MILALIYSTIIILWPHKNICKIFQLYSFDNPRDSYYDERRDDFDEEEEFEELYYSYKNPNIKYFILAFAIINFVIALIFERLIVPAFTKIWNTMKLNKLRKRKLVEDEKNFTMQELFQLSEKEI